MRIPVTVQLFDTYITQPWLKPFHAVYVSNQLSWFLSEIWLKYFDNPHSVVTSERESRSLSHKLKASNLLLPTLDLQLRNMPDVYPSSFPMTCPLCKLSLDTNLHIGMCPVYQSALKTLFQKHLMRLSDLILKADSVKFSHQLPRSLSLLNLYSWSS